MIIDFHIHGKITSTFPFKKEEFYKKINEAKNYGINSLALVEHSYANNFNEANNYLKEKYEYINDYYNIEGFKIFIGIEITTIEGIDILYIANRKYILKLKKDLDVQLKGEKNIKIDDLFNYCIPNKSLIIIAHPFRRHKEFPNINPLIFEKVDAIEINVKDLYKNGITETKNKVSKLASEWNLPIIGGSDTHHFIQVGSIKNIFNCDCNTIDEIKKNIKSNNCKIEISSDLSVKVRSASNIKKSIKKQYLSE